MTVSDVRDLVLRQNISQAWQRQYNNILEIGHAILSSQDKEQGIGIVIDVLGL